MQRLHSTVAELVVAPAAEPAAVGLAVAAVVAPAAVPAVAVETAAGAVGPETEQESGGPEVGSGQPTFGWVVRVWSSGSVPVFEVQWGPGFQLERIAEVSVGIEVQAAAVDLEVVPGAALEVAVLAGSPSGSGEMQLTDSAACWPYFGHSSA